jgi:hypothetical protein
VPDGGYALSGLQKRSGKEVALSGRQNSWLGESSYPAANKKAGRDARLFFVLNITARR